MATRISCSCQYCQMRPRHPFDWVGIVILVVIAALMARMVIKTIPVIYSLVAQ